MDGVITTGYIAGLSGNVMGSAASRLSHKWGSSPWLIVTGV